MNLLSAHFPLCPQGPAVWALRAQTDKLEYAAEMRRVVEATPNLFIREAMVTGGCGVG